MVEEGLPGEEEVLEDEAVLVVREYPEVLGCLVGLGCLREVVEVLQDGPNLVVQAEVAGLPVSPSVEVEEHLADLEDQLVEVELLSVVELELGLVAVEALRVTRLVVEVFLVIPLVEVGVHLLWEAQVAILVVVEAHQVVPSVEPGYLGFQEVEVEFQVIQLVELVCQVIQEVVVEHRAAGLAVEVELLL